MLRIIVFGVCLVAVYGQGCKDQFQSYKSCLQKNLEENQKAMKEAHEKSKENVRQCFSKNQCKEPNFDKQQGEGEHRGWGKGKGNNKTEDNGDNEKRQQCRKQISEKARDYVEKCVQKSQADFQFPERKEKKQDGGHGQHGGGHFGGMNFFRLINDSCPEASREAIQTCLTESFQRNGDRQQFAQKFNETCQAKQACYNAMSAQCQTQFNETKKALCDCAQEMVKSQKSQLDKEFDDCAGVSSSVSTTPAPSRFGRWGPGKWGAGHHAGSGVDFMAKGMCMNKDFCNGGFHQFGGSRGHHIGGGRDHGSQNGRDHGSQNGRDHGFQNGREGFSRHGSFSHGEDDSSQ